MNEKYPQSYSNHGRTDPWFHYGIAPILLICFLWSIYFTVRRASAIHIWLTALSLTILLLAFLCRSYALKVQDRVIRLEERLRLSALLSEPLRSQIPQLEERQLVALRFAADDEIPALVEKTLREKLDPKAIKKSIQRWRPDYWRV